MTKKLVALEVPAAGDSAAYVKYHNTFARFVAIKEEGTQSQARVACTLDRLLQATPFGNLPRFA